MTLSGYAGDYTENYSYDKNNRLISSVKNYGTTSAYTDYTYDKNGNQTKIEKYTKNKALETAAIVGVAVVSAAATVMSGGAYAPAF